MHPKGRPCKGSTNNAPTGIPWVHFVVLSATALRHFSRKHPAKQNFSVTSSSIWWLRHWVIVYCSTLEVRKFQVICRWHYRILNDNYQNYQSSNFGALRCLFARVALCLPLAHHCADFSAQVVNCHCWQATFFSPSLLFFDFHYDQTFAATEKKISQSLPSNKSLLESLFLANRRRPLLGPLPLQFRQMASVKCKSYKITCHFHLS